MPLVSFKNISHERLDKIIAQLPIVGNFRIKSDHDGYSTNCFFLECDDGSLCLRLYEAESFASVEQEVDALIFCQTQGLPVPRLIQWQNGDDILKANDILAICYHCIEGQSVKQKDLCPQIARQAGHILCQFIDCAYLYKSRFSHRDEYDFIHHCYIEQHDQVKKVIDQTLIQKIEDILSERLFDGHFKQLPTGLVHGDFYYGNVIMRDQNLCAIIDFGDAYYGAPFFDIVTGAMEFSFYKDQQLNSDCLKAFLIPLQGRLANEHVSVEMFYHAMLIMCLKFLLLTFGQYNENNYANRFKNLISKNMKDEIIHCFNGIMG